MPSLAGHDTPSVPETCWLSDITDRYPPLTRSATADVVVIGGGLMGVSVTYWLAAAGCDVVLLESRCLAAGSTGRNAGLMLHGVSMLEDPRLLEDVIASEHLEIDYAQNGHLSLARSLDVWERFQAEVERRPTSAPALHALTRPQCEDLLNMRISEAYCGGRWFPSGAAVHSGKFVGELARAAVRRGARVHTATPVVSVGESSSAVTIRSHRTTVRASAVVHATGASTPLLPDVTPVIKMVRAQVLATAPLPPLFAVGLGVNWGDVYGRQLLDGRFVLGGGGTDITERPDTAEAIDCGVQSALRQFLSRTFPEFPDFTVQHEWAGVVDCTRDGKPLVGPLHGGRAQWICMGFNGHGMPLALGVGKVIATALGGAELPTAVRQWSPDRFVTSS